MPTLDALEALPGELIKIKENYIKERKNNISRKLNFFEGAKINTALKKIEEAISGFQGKMNEDLNLYYESHESREFFIKRHGKETVTPELIKSIMQDDSETKEELINLYIKFNFLKVIKEYIKTAQTEKNRKFYSIIFDRINPLNLSDIKAFFPASDNAGKDEFGRLPEEQRILVLGRILTELDERGHQLPDDELKNIYIQYQPLQQSLESMINEISTIRYSDVGGENFSTLCTDLLKACLHTMNDQEITDYHLLQQTKPSYDNNLLISDFEFLYKLDLLLRKRGESIAGYNLETVGKVLNDEEYSEHRDIILYNRTRWLSDQKEVRPREEFIQIQRGFFNSINLPENAQMDKVALAQWKEYFNSLINSLKNEVPRTQWIMETCKTVIQEKEEKQNQNKIDIWLA